MGSVARCKLVPPEQRRGDSRYIPVRLKREVMARDGKQCQVCGGTKKLHVTCRVPVSRGGEIKLFNLVTFCKRCWNNKGQQTILEFCLSPFFMFEILRVGDTEPGRFYRRYQVVVRFENGDVIQGETAQDPKRTTGDFPIWVGQNQGQVMISRTKVNFIGVLPYIPGKMATLPPCLEPVFKKGD